MEQTNLGIGTIGQRLEAARLAKGVSVSQAGQATKILSKFIEAMEADDFGALSAPVYAKSFIKMYANYLGMDSNPLVDEYLAQHAPKGKPKLTDEMRQKIAAVEPTPADATDAPVTPQAPRRKIFGDVDESLFTISGKGISIKMLVSAGAALLLILLMAGVTQCSNDEEEAPAAAGGAASVAEREAVIEGTPNLYLDGPGAIAVEK